MGLSLLVIGTAPVAAVIEERFSLGIGLLAREGIGHSREEEVESSRAASRFELGRGDDPCAGYFYFFTALRALESKCERADWPLALRAAAVADGPCN